MRVDAAAIVAADAAAAAVHAVLLGMGCTLAPLARGWFPERGVLRVRLVWRSRPARISHTAVVTLRARDLERHL